jgi:hypothetical protein
MSEKIGFDKPYSSTVNPRIESGEQLIEDSPYDQPRTIGDLIRLVRNTDNLGIRFGAPDAYSYHLYYKMGGFYMSRKSKMEDCVDPRSDYVLSMFDTYTVNPVDLRQVDSVEQYD